MPNRIIKESICTSDRIAALSDFEFRLWVGLITSADDAGRGDARPAIIKGRVFPLRERVSTKDIDVALSGLAAKGCVTLYDVGGSPYFLFPNWQEHQRVRDCKPKYPQPPAIEDLRQPAASCRNPPQPAADCGLNPIQYNPNPNPNPNPKTPPLPPKGEGGGLFAEFWQAYPKKVGKGAAEKAFVKLKPGNALLKAMLSAVEAQKQSAQWQREGGQYIPNPATWLNQRRWEDETEVQELAAEQYGKFV